MDAWPQLEYAHWRPTGETLHRWLQIAGKVRLALAPHRNHFWEATFYLSARGLTSSTIPLPGGAGAFEIVFDFLADQVVITTTAGAQASVGLRPCSVAEFEREFLGALDQLDIQVKIWNMPVEIPNPVRFDQDRVHTSYYGEVVRRWWGALIAIERVFNQYRADFAGKASPVHLFWGSLDLAHTRFSGRRAPERPGADAVTLEAYSHECASVGFWAGSPEFPEAAFYAYAVPEPPGYRSATLLPQAAFYDAKMGEYLLRYEDVRRAPDPAAALLQFARSTYAAAAHLGEWQRAA